MIRYDLRCPAGHAFESWFASAAAYDRLHAAGQLTCAACGARGVGKALMAPAVAATPAAAAMPPALRPRHAPGADPRHPPESDPRAEAAEARAAALAALKREIEAKSEYVGLRFVAEARAMHAGAAPARSIYGEARRDEALALIEEGVPVAPLPFLPTRKTN